MLGALYPMVRPLLGFVEAEAAHDLAIGALERLPLPAPPADPAVLATTVFGMRFANPVGIAAGFDKNARVPDALMRLGFGFVEVGGVTRLAQPGNPRPRVFRLPADGAIINRYGLNSEGMEAVAARLSRRARQGILGVNLGANKDAIDRVGDYVALTERLGPLAEFLTLNVSSPNTPGLRELQGREFLDDLLTRVTRVRVQAGLATKILVKIAPDLTDAELDEIIEVARKHSIDGMIVSNTTVARPASLRDQAIARQTGGLSGQPLFGAATILLAKAYVRVEGAFPLIGVGGIASGEDAVAKVAAGAALVQFYSALVYQGPGLIGEIKQALARAVAAAGVGSVAGLVGAGARAWAAAEA